MGAGFCEAAGGPDRYRSLLRQLASLNDRMLPPLWPTLCLEPLNPLSYVARSLVPEARIDSGSRLVTVNGKRQPILKVLIAALDAREDSYRTPSIITFKTIILTYISHQKRNSVIDYTL